jgi:hypothetical protein
MKTTLSYLIALVGLSGLLAATPSAKAQNTVTVTPSATTYSAAGGSVTFTVTLNESETMAALGFGLVAPKGWTFGGLSGPNLPAARPQAGDGGELGFAFTEVPASQASFMFTLSYPAGLTGSQALTAIQAIFRPMSRTSTMQQLHVAEIDFAPAAQ